MPTLFNGDNSDSEGELKINTDYATNYNSWRQKEELNKLKTKYGNINEGGKVSDNGSDSESSSEEEEDESELAQQFDKDFYKALACLKSKDPRIYDEGVKFFDDANKTQEQGKTKKSKKEESIFLRDYERKIIVERDGKFSDSEEDDVSKRNKNNVDKVTYAEEQRRLKESFKQALVDEDQAEDADLLQPKSKTESEKRKEEEDYKEWLKGQRLELDDNEKEELKPLRDFWTNPNLDANEKFLRDYVLNNKFLDREYSNVDLDYEQIAHDSDENLSEDEKNIEKQEEFEHKYNFRFEEPDKEFIKRYPRTMENSLRKKDTRRSQKRAEVKQRKEEEKLRKKEELMQLKALKRKEIEEKIEKLREITGNDDIKFDDADLEGDFDPNEHDRKMKEMFDDSYYAVPEDDIKPEFPEIDEELDIEPTWDTYDPNTETIGDSEEPAAGPHCEDPEFNMDADYDASKSAQMEIVEGTKKRKRRRKSKFAELIAKEKPKFDPKVYQSYEEYFDKYYALDYEDMIGDLPCRFKYRKVVPNDYGLSVEEILMADDKELNKWCSLKRALQYRPEHMELNDVRTYKQKSRDEGLKKKVLRSLYSPPEEEQEENKTENPENPSTTNGDVTKKKRRRKKKKVENVDSVENKDESNRNETEVAEKPAKISKAEKRKQKAKEPSEQPEYKKRKVDTPLEKSNAVAAEGNDLAASDPKKPKNKNKPKKKLEKTQKQKPKHKKNRDGNDDIASLNPERLKTYGINPKKLKNKLKYGKKQ